MEPLSYSLKPTVKKLCSEAKRKVVIETARRLTLLGVDILKAKFPLEITETPNEDGCFSACAELLKQVMFHGLFSALELLSKISRARLKLRVCLAQVV